ncbi:hypothetical protein Tco_1097700 [Tanacetum coccineum]
MAKPPSPCNELSKESSLITPSNQASPQPHTPTLINPYVNVVLQANQNRNETQPHSPPLIDPYVNVVLQANQNRNETQPQLPPSPTREMLVDEINQLQDLSNLLAMHLSNHTTNPTPSTQTCLTLLLLTKLNIMLAIAHVVVTTKLNSWL